MGKSKPRNRQKNRGDPTGKATKPPADPELAAIREQRILPVLKDLQSADLKTRSAAASAISNIIEDTKCRKLLLREQIVRVLFEQTLTDASLETRTAGWGILRNLALEEEADFCVHLYRQDILTAIEAVVQTIIQTIESQESPVSKLPKRQQDLLWSITTSVVSLIASLSEAQEEIVVAISKLSTITNFLFGLLSFESTPTEVLNEVLSCLAAITEDNKPLVEKVAKNTDWLKLLDQIKDSGDLKSVAACGVLHNIFVSLQWFDHNTPIDGASDAALLPSLIKALDTPTHANGTNGTNGTSTSYSSPDQVLQLALEITASIATSLQEALEHGSKHEKPFEGFDEPTEDLIGEDDIMDEGDESDEGDDEDDDEHEMTQEEIEADMDLVTGDGPEGDDDDTEELTLDRLVRDATPKILSLASNSDSPAQTSAISALNNIAWTIGSIDFSSGHLGSLQQFWSSLSQQIWAQIISPVLASNTADIELASAITSLAWAVARSVKGVINIQPEEQRKFMALYQASKGLKIGEPNGDKKSASEQTDSFQSLGVKSIGVLGCLAMDPAPVDLNREIGVFLVTVLSSLPDTPAADAVEALNQLFDIYADKSYAFDEPVFWGNGFYKHLEEILPKTKKMAKSIDKRTFEELRARSDEAVLNLDRFLNYKRKEMASK